MDKESNSNNKDFSKYDIMETNELEEILRADFYLSGANSSDEEQINYILEVLTKRDKDVLRANLVGAEKSLEEFKKKHTQELQHTSRKKGTSRIIRFSTVAAAICILILGSITANSVGSNIWDCISTWTESVFRVESHGQAEADFDRIPEPLKTTAEKLAEYGITENVIPTVLPDGCEFKEYNIFSDSEIISIVTELSCDSEPLIFQYVIHLRTIYDSEYQKDEGEPDIIEHDGILFYVFTNYGKYTITWMDGNLECMITGVPEEFIEEIINSI